MIALFLDTETTGLDPDKDALTEVCAMLVDCPEGARHRVLRTFSTLVQTDPAPFPADVTRLTGLTADLCGEHGVPLPVAVETVRRMAARAECVVAWNAPFDRAFLERAGFATACPWVDAQRNVDWRSLGASRESLVVVAAEVGRMVNPCPHAALGDVMTMVELVAPRIREAVEDAKVPHVYLSVVHSPRGSNDALKELGYRWDSARRVWELRVKAEELYDERAKLPPGCYAWHSDDQLPVVPLVTLEVDCHREQNGIVDQWLATRWDPARKLRVAEKVREDYADEATQGLYNEKVMVRRAVPPQETHRTPET